MPAPLTLDVFKKIAAERGGRCLSTKYINKEEKLEFECSEGHIWSATAGSIKNGGTWCPICARISKSLSLDVFHKIAEGHGGLCISTDYVNIKTELKFVCSEGHSWSALAATIKNGSWCSQCHFDSMRLSLDVFHKIAEERGGRCLSTEYLGVSEKLEFECSEGHVWSATGGSIKRSRGSWCPRCVHDALRLSLDNFHKIAAERGGRCLSTQYKQIFEKLEFECAAGHRWKTLARTVQKGGWCPECAGVRPYSLGYFQDLARKNGGRCLSTEYKKIHKKLAFECADGHQWKAAGSSIKNGSWCPYCVSGRGERNAIEFASFESGLVFEKTRPDWLKTTNNGKLELDGYSLESGLAIEYQGIQHYEYTPKLFHQNGIEGFIRQQERDRLKAELVAARGILLLAVPASPKADQVSVRRAVIKAAEDACFPLFGINLEFTLMCAELNPVPMHRFSACLPYAAFRACVGE